MIGSITYLLKKTPKCLSIFLLLVFMLNDQPIRADSKFVDLDVIVEEAKIITGRVFDANNEPLIGATILEKVRAMEWLPTSMESLAFLLTTIRRH